MPYSAPAAVATALPGFRNLLHNGDMRINQRGTTAISWTATGTNRLIDRWTAGTSGSQSITMGWDSANIPNLAAFRYSLLWQSNSAYTTVAAGDYAIVTQALEGYDVAQLGWGTTSAKNLTLSFWVRSSVTGTMGGAVRCQLSTRSYAFSFPVVAGPNFTQVTIAIPADVTSLVVDNNDRLNVVFSYGSGSTYTAPAAGTWYTNNYVTAPGCTNFNATSGAQVWITGVQLETSTTPTAFEFRPYEVELTLCQRYFFQTVSTTAAGQLITDFGIASATNVAYLPIRFPVPMRAAFGAAGTTFGSSALTTLYMTDRIGNYDLISIAGTAASSTHQGDIVCGSTAFNMTQRSPTVLYSKSATPAYVSFSAEL